MKIEVSYSYKGLVDAGIKNAADLMFKDWIAENCTRQITFDHDKFYIDDSDFTWIVLTYPSSIFPEIIEISFNDN